MSSTETQFDKTNRRTVSLGSTHQNFMRNAARSTSLPRELQIDLLDLLDSLGSYPRRAVALKLAQVLDAISDELVHACTPPTDETGRILPLKKDSPSPTSVAEDIARAVEIGAEGVHIYDEDDREQFAQRITRAVLEAVADGHGVLNAVRRCVGAEVKE